MIEVKINLMQCNVKNIYVYIPYDLTYKWNLINKTTSKQNVTRDIEIKHKLTVTIYCWGKEEEGWLRNMYKGPMDKAKGGWDPGWEVGTAGEGENGRGKMGTTVLEQQ